MNDGEILAVFSDFLAESLDSKDPIRQREALSLSERIAWRMKSIAEHQEFVRDCGSLLVDSDLELQSLLSLSWKILFWQSFAEPLRSLLGNCDLDISIEGKQRSLIIRCNSTTDVDQLYQSLDLISRQIYRLTGYIRQVYLTAYR
jgi:hypothetical protein